MTYFSNKVDWRHSSCGTQLVKISPGLALDAEKLVYGLGFSIEKTLFVSDEKIWKNCRKFFAKNFFKKTGQNLILKKPQPDEKNWQKIAAAAKNYDFILCLGSGTINDLCKFTSARTKIPYAIFAAAASMNGYLSKNASMKISGHKKTLSATLALAVFCDLKILQAAPLRLTKAGIGDAMCFYSCWFDWYLAHKVFATKFNKKPFLMLQSKMDFFIKNFRRFSIGDEPLLKLLIEILLISGKAMTTAGGSYPASQSEHLIAHTIEMKYPKIAAKTLHGLQIAVTTLTSAKLQKLLLDPNFKPHIPLLYPGEFSARSPVSNFEANAGNSKKIKINFCKNCMNKRRNYIKKSKKTFEIPALISKKIKNFFGSEIARQCQKEFAQKIPNNKKSEIINKNLQSNWPKIRKTLARIYFEELKLRKIFTHFKIKTSCQSLGLSNQEYQDCVAHARFIRNRFSCLDLIELKADFPEKIF
jgi:glycerol-1-phosphate dehydrogenase [NAD(P)+]